MLSLERWGEGWRQVEVLRFRSFYRVGARYYFGDHDVNEVLGRSMAGECGGVSSKFESCASPSAPRQNDFSFSLTSEHK